MVCTAVFGMQVVCASARVWSLTGGLLPSQQEAECSLLPRNYTKVKVIARLARGGIWEHEAFLGHEMRVPEGTGCAGESMDGKRWGKGTGKGNHQQGKQTYYKPAKGQLID